MCQSLDGKLPNVNDCSLEFILTCLELVYSNNDLEKFGLEKDKNKLALLFADRPFVELLTKKRRNFCFEAFAECLKYKEIETGEIIFTKGQKKTQFYLLLKGGIVKTKSVCEANGLSCKKHIQPGKFFGSSQKDPMSQSLLVKHKKITEYDYISTENSKLLYQNQESVNKIVFCCNLLDNREDAWFLLYNTEYFCRFNCSKQIQQRFLDGISILIDRIWVKKGQNMLKIGQNINYLYIIRDGTLKVLKKEYEKEVEMTLERILQMKGISAHLLNKNTINDIKKYIPIKVIAEGAIVGLSEYFSLSKMSKYQIIGNSALTSVLKIDPNELCKILLTFCGLDFINNNIDYFLKENNFGEKLVQKNQSLCSRLNTDSNSEINKVVDKYLKNNKITSEKAHKSVTPNLNKNQHKKISVMKTINNGFLMGDQLVKQKYGGWGNNGRSTMHAKKTDGFSKTTTIASPRPENFTITSNSPQTLGTTYSQSSSFRITGRDYDKDYVFLDPECKEDYGYPGSMDTNQLALEIPDQWKLGGRFRDCVPSPNISNRRKEAVANFQDESFQLKTQFVKIRKSHQNQTPLEFQELHPSDINVNNLDQLDQLYQSNRAKLIRRNNMKQVLINTRKNRRKFSDLNKHQCVGHLKKGNSGSSLRSPKFVNYDDEILKTDVIYQKTDEQSDISQGSNPTSYGKKNAEGLSTNGSYRKVSIPKQEDDNCLGNDYKFPNINANGLQQTMTGDRNNSSDFSQNKDFLDIKDKFTYERDSVDSSERKIVPRGRYARQFIDYDKSHNNSENGLGSYGRFNESNLKASDNYKNYVGAKEKFHENHYQKEILIKDGVDNHNQNSRKPFNKTHVSKINMRLNLNNNSMHHNEQLSMYKKRIKTEASNRSDAENLGGRKFLKSILEKDLPNKNYYMNKKEERERERVLNIERLTKKENYEQQQEGSQ